MSTLILNLSVPTSLEPRAVEIEERFNEPFLLRVEAVSKDPDVDLDAVIGCGAALDVLGGPALEPVKSMTGVVRRAKLQRALVGGLSRYVLEIVPNLWLLGQRRSYRTFQVMSEPAIALLVLREWSVAVDARIDLASYPRREMRVQYGESDLAFVSRMLEEAGVATWFETIGGVSTLVLGDAAHEAKPSFRLPYFDEGTARASDAAYASGIEIRRRLRPGRYTVKDVDLRLPSDKQPVASATSPDATPLETLLERFHYLPGTSLVESATPGGDTPVADERIAVRSSERAGQALVTRRLAAKRGDHKTLSFETSEAALSPGTTFLVVGHTSRELGEGRPWLATRTSFRADVHRAARVQVEASPTASAYRPPLRIEQPLADSVEPAAVICRGGEEIDPNELGGVRIHFPWDRGPPIGGAWVPVSQPWAGQGFGKINLPREGQEVLVEFASGNPDRPVITGRMYTATQPVPYKLPDNKTQSGWRSNSTGNTGGYNELMMEDAEGKELLRMHAQRDLSTTVLRDESRTVENDRAATVGRDDLRTVKRDQALRVDGNVIKSVGGASDSLVGGDGTHLIGRSFRSTTIRDRSELTTGSSSATIGLNDDVTIQGVHVVTGINSTTFTVGDTSIEMTSSSIIMKTASGAKAIFEPGKIEIKCDILQITATSECRLKAPTVGLNHDLIQIQGHGITDLQSSMITLNGGAKPFSRLMDTAPDKITDGAATVLVGIEMATSSLELAAKGLSLDVRSFEAHEGLNQPFLVTLMGVSKDPNVDLDAPIGSDASLLVRHPRGARRYAGIVRRIDQVEVEPSGLSTYLVEIVPTLWALTHTRNHRAFQDMSELDVALAILAEWEITPDLRLDRGRYRRREIRIQYGESDLTFFARLLEEAGVSYWFEPRSESTAMVLGDAPHRATPRVVPYREERMGVEDRAYAYDVSVERRLRPGQYTIRDRDFRRPSDQALEGQGKAIGGRVAPIEAALERFHYVPGGALFDAKSADTPTADDRIAVRTDLDHASVRATMRLQAKRADARIITLSSTELEITPGSTVVITGHPSAELATEPPLLVHTTILTGRHDRLLPMVCDARSALEAFSPPLVTERPRVRGIETATVVGPAGEEIHTDEFGRVRVHFHWDRESKLDDRSSCWLHASQPWAGTGYGGVNLPRGGQEVLVEFVGGDPDRPLVVGRVFTDLRKVPYTLPLNKTQSGWKSNSTGGGGGFNEIMFEDKSAEELVRMRAQRDLDTKVRRNEDRDVRNDRATKVQRDDRRKVGRDQSHSIEGSAQKVIGGDSDTIVRRGATHYVRSNARSSVAQQKSDFTGGSRDTESGGFRDITVEARRQVSGPDHVYNGGASSVHLAWATNIWKLGSSSLAITASQVKLASKQVNLLAKTISISSPAIIFEGTSTVTLRGGVTELYGGLVSLNGPELPAARVTEPAPDKVRNGAGTVQIGGPSVGSGAVVNPDGSITIGGITIQGSPEFISRTLADLAAMGKTPRGKEAPPVAQDPRDGDHITITDGSFEGSKATPDFWGWLTGRPSSVGVSYDPHETHGDIPRDAILYDNLRQGDRLRRGQGKDERWLDEEKEYLRDRGWKKYRTDDTGTLESF